MKARAQALSHSPGSTRSAEPSRLLGTWEGTARLCPTLVCSAEGDDISASASQLAEALNCAKQYVRFTAAEGAGDHCESGARALYHARSFGWLDAIVLPPSGAPGRG